VTHLPTNLTNVDVANAFRSSNGHTFKKSLHDAGWGQHIDAVAVKKQKGRRYKRRVAGWYIVYLYKNI